MAKVVFGMDIWAWEIVRLKQLSGIVVAILRVLTPPHFTTFIPDFFLHWLPIHNTLCIRNDIN